MPLKLGRTVRYLCWTKMGCVPPDVHSVFCVTCICSFSPHWTNFTINLRSVIFERRRRRIVKEVKNWKECSVCRLSTRLTAGLLPEMISDSVLSVLCQAIWERFCTWFTVCRCLGNSLLHFHRRCDLSNPVSNGVFHVCVFMMYTFRW